MPRQIPKPVIENRPVRWNWVAHQMRAAVVSRIHLQNPDVYITTVEVKFSIPNIVIARVTLISGKSAPQGIAQIERNSYFRFRDRTLIQYARKTVCAALI